MKLELGKRYVCKDGSITGPLISFPDDAFPFRDPMRHTVYTETGKRERGLNRCYEIVAPYADPAPTEQTRMTFDKRIVTHEVESSTKYSNGFIISDGTYSKSIKFFLAAAAEAKRDFPHLTDDNIECFVITNSTYNKGFAGVRFSLPGPTAHPEYRAVAKLDFSTT